MRHILFEPDSTCKVALLIKASAFNKYAIEKNYTQELNTHGVQNTDLVAFTLEYDEHNKAPVKLIKEYLDKLLSSLRSIGTKYLLVTDSNYFKVLTKVKKADAQYGYVLPCAIAGYEDLHVVLSINYQQLVFNPTLQAKLSMSLSTLGDHIKGTYSALGGNIIHSEYYPESLQEIQEALNSLHQYESLSCDIEAFSLRFNEAGIGTVSFAWDEHNGLAFACDYLPIEEANKQLSNYEESYNPAFHGVFCINPTVRSLLKNFFETYKGKIKWHNSAYDVKVIIYTLWMQDLLDIRGMLAGLDVFTKSFDDTKIIAYLATNSTAGNVLGLKHLAHEFAGNWAEDNIKDIRLIPLPKLLRYNLVDALSTNYVAKKYVPIMVQDNQQTIYEEIMLPSLRTIIQMELVGMPMSSTVIKDTKAKLEEIMNEHLSVIQNSPIINMLNMLLQNSAMEQANAKLKTKQHPIEHFADQKFNPNSGQQLQVLLYKQMGLPIIDFTDTKQPATGAGTIEKLINHTDNPAYQEVLKSLIAYGKVSKILTTFIPAFEDAIPKGDGMWYLHGSFNLGGTVSGRLSSSEPNLQNLPAGSLYGKLIKECFRAPAGWIFAGADFNSLEDYISALTTKDPNKLAVYEQGFDGHCLRAAYYFKDQLLNIDVTNPTSVNSIKDEFPELRQKSKAPTFALTYQGTYFTLHNNLGIPIEEAKMIEQNYHVLYKVSDDYVQSRLQQASVDGYVEVAFGLRVRTPMLKQVMYNTGKIPYEAAAEGRTAGNALGQSYGLLNNRAANAFFKKVHESPYRYDVLPVALIHDAIYIIMKDDVAVVEWVNRELIDCMKWQELPEIQHPTVKLGANLDLFYPSWKNAITLPNNATQDEIRSLCDAKKKKE